MDPQSYKKNLYKITEVAHEFRDERPHLDSLPRITYGFISSFMLYVKESEKKAIYLQIIEDIMHKGDLDIDDIRDFSKTKECARNGCINVFIPNTTGRPRKFCSNKCKSQHSRDIKEWEIREARGSGVWWR